MNLDSWNWSRREGKITVFQGGIEMNIATVIHFSLSMCGFCGKICSYRVVLPGIEDTRNQNLDSCGYNSKNMVVFFQNWKKGTIPTMSIYKHNFWEHTAMTKLTIYVHNGSLTKFKQEWFL